METEKKCPRCPNSIVMLKIDRKNILPALTVNFEIAEKQGLYLQAYKCPSCNLVELYHIER